MGPLTAGPLVAGPAAAALEAGRDRFNALFAAARRADPSLDASRFSAHLTGRVQPVVAAAEAAVPGCALAVTEALYEASLDLLVHGLLDSGRAAGLAEVWELTLPAAATHLATEPRRVVAALCNGALRVVATPGARPGQWAQLMAASARLAPGVGHLLEAGLVAAWRAGLAHAREAALDRLAVLPPALAAAAIGLATVTSEDVGRLAADRWWWPGAAGADAVRVVARVGAFRGFGGAFLVPPRIAGVHAGAFRVEGGTGPYLLHADVFGATLQRAPEHPGAGDGVAGEPPAPPAFALEHDGMVTSPGDRTTLAAIPTLAEATSWLSSTDTLAVTTPNSYAVTLVARVAG